MARSSPPRLTATLAAAILGALAIAPGAQVQAPTATPAVVTARARAEAPTPAPAPAAPTAASVAQFFMPSSMARVLPRWHEPIWIGHPRPRRPVGVVRYINVGGVPCSA